MICGIPDLYGYFFENIILMNETQYALQREIGSGGFAKVFLATNKRTKKQFAIKRITFSSKKEKQRVEQEIKIMEQFRGHQYFLTMYDYCFQKSSVPNCEDALLVLQYIQKGSLFDFITRYQQKKANIPEDLIIRIVLGVCSAIKLMHHSIPPIAHRDIKPHNILLSDELTPLLTDFGSVSYVNQNESNQEKADSIKGKLQEEVNETTTQAYCPPELYDYGGVLDDNIVDQRVDIWQLGCLLYHCAFHVNPFDRELIIRGGSMKMAVHNGNYSIHPDSPYSNDFHNVIKCFLKVNASDRPFINEAIALLNSINDKTSTNQNSRINPEEI